MVPMVPTEDVLRGGSFVFAFFCAARKMSLSRAMAASRRDDGSLSADEQAGLTMCGKTMMSRSGRRNRSLLGSGLAVVALEEHVVGNGFYPESARTQRHLQDYVRDGGTDRRPT